MLPFIAVHRDSLIGLLKEWLHFSEGYPATKNQRIPLEHRTREQLDCLDDADYFPERRSGAAER